MKIGKSACLSFFALKTLLAILSIAGIPDDWQRWSQHMKLLGEYIESLSWTTRAVAAASLTIGAFSFGRLYQYLARIGKTDQTPPPRQPKTNPQEEKSKAAHELSGARAWDFALYQLVCLLVDDETTWPLKSQRARDEFNGLCRYMDTIPGLGEEIGYNTDDFPDTITDYTEASGTIHQVRITRIQARQYLHSQARSIPEFLDERFDAGCKPKVTRNG